MHKLLEQNSMSESCMHKRLSKLVYKQKWSKTHENIQTEAQNAHK